MGREFRELSSLGDTDTMADEFPGISVVEEGQGLPSPVDSIVVVDLSAPRFTLKSNMEKEVERDPSKKAAFDIMFGKDHNCLDWDYEEAESLPGFYDYEVLRPATKEDLKTSYKEIVLFQAFHCLMWAMLSEMNSHACNPRAALFRLKGGMNTVGVNQTAMFRSQIIWPLWGSTQAFWEFMVKLFKQVYGKYNLQWPHDVPHLNAMQVKEYFQSIGCDDGVKVAQALIMYSGEDYCVTTSTDSLY